MQFDRTYCPEHDTDHLEAGRCPVDNVTMQIAGQLELAVADPKPCRHPDSMFGRCADCGRTWTQQAADWDRDTFDVDEPADDEPPRDDVVAAARHTEQMRAEHTARISDHAYRTPGFAGDAR